MDDFRLLPTDAAVGSWALVPSPEAARGQEELHGPPRVRIWGERQGAEDRRAIQSLREMRGSLWETNAKRKALLFHLPRAVRVVPFYLFGGYNRT